MRGSRLLLAGCAILATPAAAGLASAAQEHDAPTASTLKPVPVVLVHKPYVRTDGSMHYARTATYFVAHGYAYAMQDVRDRGDSSGDFSIQDVQPDGKAAMLGSRPVGVVSARYRSDPLAKPPLLTPGKPELFKIALGGIGHEFMAGHRIRIDISSSAYSMYNPNQNTGNPIATDTEWKVAHQRILHDAAHPSALVLPVVAVAE